MDYKNITDMLIKQTISDIRNIARLFGAPCPTKGQKAAIVGRIVSLLKGEQQPLANISKRGRPININGFQEDRYLKTIRQLLELCPENTAVKYYKQKFANPESIQPKEIGVFSEQLVKQYLAKIRELLAPENDGDFVIKLLNFL